MDYQSSPNLPGKSMTTPAPSTPKPATMGGGSYGKKKCEEHDKSGCEKCAEELPIPVASALDSARNFHTLPPGNIQNRLNWYKNLKASKGSQREPDDLPSC